MEELDRIVNPKLSKEELLVFYYNQYELEKDNEKKLILLKRIEILKKELDNEKK